MLERMRALIRAAGCVCYDSAEKIDVCKSPYVVCYDHGVEALPQTKGMLGVQVYEVVCLVPFDDVKGLEPLTAKVREALKGLEGLLFTGSGGTGIEETFKARAVTLTYSATKRI